MKRLFHSPIFLLVFFILHACLKQDDTQAANVTKLTKAGKEALDKANYYNKEGKSDSAVKYYLKSKESYAAAKKKVNAAYSLLKAVEIFNDYNDYDEVQTLAVEALHHLDLKKDFAYLPTLYSDLGISFAMTGDLRSAEANYLKGKKYAADAPQKATFDNNIAYAYILAGNYDKAFLILSDAMKKYDFPDSIPIKSNILDNYGFSAFKAGKRVAGNPMQDALRIRLENKDAIGAIASYTHLAEAGFRENPKESLEKAALAERLALQNNAPSDRLGAMSFLIKHGNPEISQRYGKIYLRVSDSLQLADRKAKKAFALIKYNYRNEHEKNVAISLENAEQKTQMQRSIFISVLFGLLAIGILTFYWKRRKEIRLKASYETEVRISTKLHDELANEVHKTIVFAETQKLDAPENKEALLTRLETIYEGTRNISRDNSDVPEDADFGNLVSDLLMEYRTDECNVLAQGIAKVNWERLAHFKRVAFYRILQEILANMRKHSKCSRALLSFSQTGKNLVFNYSDDGVGQDVENPTRKNGLRIMENRILELKGTFTFESKPGNGFRAYVEFPM